MKRIALALLLASVIPVFAADATPPPAKPTCGKTVDECQKANDALTDQVAKLTLAYQAVRQQRISVETAKDDAEVGTYVQQQAAAAATLPKK